VFVSVIKKDKTLKGAITLPPSKSISNRLLIIKAICRKDFEIQNISNSSDTKGLQNILQSPSKIIDAGDAGTAYRFLTAYLCLTEGEKILTGSERMKKRPVGALVNALKEIGAHIEFTESENYPPLIIHGGNIKGGEISVDASISSQFISALLLIAPALKDGLKLHLYGSKVSEPYIDMTLKLMAEFGIKFEKNIDSITVSPQQYQVKDIEVESDWSSAAFFYQMAALADNRLELRLKGLKKSSIQGDKIIADLIYYFRVDTTYEEGGILLTKGKEHIPKLRFNFSSYPDLVPSLLVTCAATGVKTEVWGIDHLRIKETDRIAALQKELGKTGVRFYEQEGNFICEGKMHPADYLINTYNDHRMAMAFAPLAVLFGKIDIENADVVKKSYPLFWDDLRSLGFEVR
jgi:3-phosphoshikimate 1-carboxyvinyltransferase